MNTNMFENAHFGKMYKTRNERKAVYLGNTLPEVPTLHFLSIENSNELILYLKNGKVWVDEVYKGSGDIIDEWSN